MSNLVLHKNQADEQILMRLLSKKINITLAYDELKSLDQIVKHWIVNQNLSEADIYEQALRQAVLKVVETKFRPRIFRLPKTVTLKFDLMQAFVLHQVLENIIFEQSSFEINVATRVFAQIDKQL
jgi:hypothetical protein